MKCVVVENLQGTFWINNVGKDANGQSRVQWIDSQQLSSKSSQNFVRRTRACVFWRLTEQGWALPGAAIPESSQNAAAESR